MRIEHIAMYVNDLEATKEFFVKFFNASSNDKYNNPKTGLQTYFLTFEDNARLEIMTRPDVVSSKKSLMQTGYIHLAFSVGSKEKVDELTTELKEAGYEVLSGPRTTGDGYYESCILGPEGNQIEITE
ncbi:MULTISPECIES: VOC family protein [Clostridium]|uniref:VOC family protein n=1 Tax=Clostridium nitritogenes TaxID=83340 RepID=A0ABN1LN69_9CLOT|nr:VOC family protein [Clostridium baratii]MBT9831978.1 glyoxalase [Clostridium baratii]MDY3208119.1 VOC family protein [Clostridium baratii]STA99885.1 Glyoxalase/Bleomycin resistance protein/Dioxygenase superfamily [Clostridium baratii]